MAKETSRRARAASVGRGVAQAFPRLSITQVKALARRARTKKYTSGETVVREGTYANGFYIVISGLAEVSQLDKAGKDARLRRLGPGDFFGEIGLLAPPRRTATVRAASALEVAALESDEFFSMMTGSALSAASVQGAAIKRLARTPAAAKTAVRKPATRK